MSKSVPFVDLDGYYIQDVKVEDEQTGVIQSAQDTDNPEEMTTGYIVTYPVKQGLYKPRLDTARLIKDFGEKPWEQWPQTLTEEQINQYWVEGLSQEEIDKLNQPAPLSEIDQIKKQMAEQNAAVWDFILGGMI